MKTIDLDDKMQFSLSAYKDRLTDEVVIKFKSTDKNTLEKNGRIIRIPVEYLIASIADPVPPGEEFPEYGMNSDLSKIFSLDD
jgi:hypothetical protein